MYTRNANLQNVRAEKKALIADNEKLTKIIHTLNSECDKIKRKKEIDSDNYLQERQRIEGELDELKEEYSEAMINAGRSEIHTVRKELSDYKCKQKLAEEELAQYLSECSEKKQ